MKRICKLKKCWPHTQRAVFAIFLLILHLASCVPYFDSPELRSEVTPHQGTHAMVRTSRRVASEGAPVESSRQPGKKGKREGGSRTHKKTWREKGAAEEGRKVGGGKKVRMLLSFFLFLRRQFSPAAPRVVSLRRTVAVATCDLA